MQDKRTNVLLSDDELRLLEEYRRTRADLKENALQSVEAFSLAEREIGQIAEVIEFRQRDQVKRRSLTP